MQKAHRCTQEGNLGEKKPFPFLRLLNDDLVCRCWPARSVVLGTKVCKWLRPVLSQHPKAELHSLESLCYQYDHEGKQIFRPQICFESVSSELRTLFSQPPEMHLVTDRLFGSQDSDLFSTFFEQMQGAREEGWKGPSLLSLNNSFAEDDFPIQPRQLQALAKSIADSPYLTSFKLAQVSLDVKGAQKLLGETLASLPRLAELHLDDVAVRLCDDAAVDCESAAWLERLSMCTSLQTVSLTGHSDNQKAKVVSDLAAGLHTLSNLTQLRICDYNVGDAAADLASALTHLPALKTLKLAYTEVQGEGARALCHALRSCTALEQLLLSPTDWMPDDPDDFANADKFRGSVGRNIILRDAGSELAASLAACPKLRVLALEDLLLTADDGAQLGAVLRACGQSLEHLILRDYMVLPEAAERLSETLGCCTALTSLACWYCRIETDEEYDGFNALVEALEKLPALQHLFLAETDCALDFDTFLRMLHFPTLRHATLNLAVPDCSELARFQALLCARGCALSSLRIHLYSTSSAMSDAEHAQVRAAVHTMTAACDGILDLDVVLPYECRRSWS